MFRCRGGRYALAWALLRERHESVRSGRQLQGRGEEARVLVERCLEWFHCAAVQGHRQAALACGQRELLWRLADGAGAHRPAPAAKPRLVLHGARSLTPRLSPSVTPYRRGPST